MSLYVAPSWLIMWLSAAGVFFGCKAWLWLATPARGPWFAHLAYWFAWPGLDAVAFLDDWRTIRKPSLGEWWFAAAKTAFGMGLFCSGGVFVTPDQDLLRGWIGMLGIVFILHFGIFHLLSCLWRALGRSAAPLMDQPWAARSVSDFWGRRWNRAFRDFVHRSVFQPMTNCIGPNFALAATFLLSGVLHELVISVPAQGGYGGPSAYFCLQALGIAAERSRFGRALGLGRGVRGRLFAAIVLLAPAGWLFPPVFVRSVVLPMMDAFGAA